MGPGGEQPVADEVEEAGGPLGEGGLGLGLAQRHLVLQEGGQHPQQVLARDQLLVTLQILEQRSEDILLQMLQRSELDLVVLHEPGRYHVTKVVGDREQRFENLQHAPPELLNIHRDLLLCERGLREPLEALDRAGHQDVGAGQVVGQQASEVPEDADLDEDVGGLQPALHREVEPGQVGLLHLLPVTLGVEDDAECAQRLRSA